MAPRAQSHVRLRDAPSEEVQDAQDLPRTCRRWWPDFQRPPVGAQLRREVRAAIRRQPERNNFAMWQMNFPATLPNGQRNPVCALGECGDPSCPTYRPKRPEVRQAVEQTILEKCQAHFRAGALKTYASIGCGLLGQDWIVLEQLRELGQLPKRAIFVELRTARPVITGEGAMFPRGGAGGGLNLRQTGFIGELGPEFAFSALLQFESECCGGLIFDFSNGSSDRIFAQLHDTKPGALVFGAEGHSFVVEECWEANGQAHSYLFTVSAVGIYNVYRDGEIIARSYGPAPRCCRRQALYVGGRMGGGTAFKGRIQKIKVWDQEVDPMATDLAYSHEVDNAHQTIAQWYKNEMDIYSFGSLAGYAAACEKDRRFAADLLVKIDVHDELDGYDDFVCKALAPDGLALTLGGPGKSWRRSGTGWLPVDMKCEILDTAEEKVLVPWAFMGAFPGHADETPSLAFAARAGGARVTEHGPSGRRGPKQRRPRYTGRKSRQSRQSRERSRACSEPRKPPKQTERWYSMADDAESLENLAKRLFPRPTAIEDLLDEVDLDAAADHSLLSQLDALENEDDDELPGLVLYNQ